MDATNEIVDSSNDKHAPVFVDPTGRRRRWLRWAAYALAALGVGYVTTVVVSLLGGPIAPHTLLPLPGVPKAAPGAAAHPPTVKATATTQPSPLARLTPSTAPRLTPLTRPVTTRSPLATARPTARVSPAPTTRPKGSTTPTGTPSRSPGLSPSPTTTPTARPLGP